MVLKICSFKCFEQSTTILEKVELFHILFHLTQVGRQLEDFEGHKKVEY